MTVFGSENQDKEPRPHFFVRSARPPQVYVASTSLDLLPWFSIAIIVTSGQLLLQRDGPSEAVRFFTSLPPEIRNQVYEHCLAFDFGRFSYPSCRSMSSSSIPISTSRRWAKLPRFMTTCERMYRETSHMALTRVAVAFSRSSRGKKENHVHGVPRQVDMGAARGSFLSW